MATNRELLQSIFSALVLVQNAEDLVLDTPGVHEILRGMDDLADELREVFE